MLRINEIAQLYEASQDNLAINFEVNSKFIEDNNLSTSES
jgi:hypothetical protein